MYSKKNTSRLTSTSEGASEIFKMSERYMASASSSTIVAIVLVLVLSIDMMIEAKPSALTKKPPFNGSIFGKRSNLPPNPTANFGTVTSGAVMSAPIDNYPVWPLLYEQVQQQQEVAWLNAAINRCLAAQQAQQEQTVGAEVLSDCDELLALATIRDRFP